MDWRQDPLGSIEPTKVARRVMQERFRDSGVYRWRNDWWVWRENRWVVMDDERLKDLIWVCLEDAVWERPTRGGLVLERYSPDKQKIDGVARALEALVRIDTEQVPCWIGTPLGNFDPGTTIAFEDVLFNAATGKTMKRPKNWFDPAVLPVKYDESVKCPRWEQAVGEWSDNDPLWAELLARWMGYCLLGTRRYARWMLMYGKIRGGKGTISSVIRKLIGRAAFMSSSLEDLAGEFGMDGLERSKVLSINEVNEVEGGRSLREYMSLPASQYSTLDGERVERVGDDTFVCTLGAFDFLGFRLQPVLTARVDVRPDGYAASPDPTRLLPNAKQAPMMSRFSPRRYVTSHLAPARRVSSAEIRPKSDRRRPQTSHSPRTFRSSQARVRDPRRERRDPRQRRR